MAPRKTVDELLRERLQELGAIGGKASAEKLSKAERTAKARKAATVRCGESKLQPESLTVHGDPLDGDAKGKRPVVWKTPK